MKSFAFFSLQGLGNSILNFPILNILREQHPVEVVCYRNGSSAFFETFHPNVRVVHKPTGMLLAARKIKVSNSFATYPTWRRELSSSLLVRADRKFIMRPLREKHQNWKGLWAYSAEPQAAQHDLENNIELLKRVPNSPQDGWESLINIRSALNLPATSEVNSRILVIHPTASKEVKFYNLKFWAELLQTLKPQYNQIKLLCGSNPIEVRFCESIASCFDSEFRNRLQVCSNFSFDKVVQIIDSAEYFIGIDSSLMHLAALLDKPTVALWSFANFRAIYPYGNHSKVYLPKETLTSRQHQYPNTSPQYLKRASAEQVATIIRSSIQPSFYIKPLYKEAVAFYEF